MDNNKKKKILTGVIIAIVLVAVVGVTYALWSYFQIGPNQQLVAGDIYMKYTETSNTINIQDAMPSKTPGDEYFQFTIEGKNTYTKPIWYEIVIKWGEEPVGRSERIPDEFIRFRLTEQLPGGEETEVIKEGKYENFKEGKKIWVNTIGAQSPETTITYKLYMWVSDEMVLASGDVAASSDMDMETWNNDAFASVKVTVNGDFEEKTLDNETPTTTPVSCFEYELIDKKYIYNSERTEEAIEACTTYFEENYSYLFDSQNTARAFCEGTGRTSSDFSGHTFEYELYDILDESKKQKLLEMGIVKTIPKLEAVITNYKNTEEGCGSDVIIPEEIEGHKVTIIGSGDELGYEYWNDRYIVEINNKNNSYNNLKTTIYNYNSGYVKPLVEELFPDYITSFAHKNLTSVVLPSSLKVIGEYAFYENKLRIINIPSNVTLIANNAFNGNQLTTVDIPSNVTTIDNGAFQSNRLTTVDIPNSVTTIGNGTFEGNQLTEVTIGNGVKYISVAAFPKDEYSNPNLSKITIDRTCDEIKNIEKDSTDTTKLYPWLSFDGSSSSYSAPGVTIYGSGGEVCDTF